MKKKLTLNKQTVRVLADDSLNGVVGGISGTACIQSYDILCGGHGTGSLVCGDSATCPDTSKGCNQSYGTCGPCTTSP
ncbi:MAG TPA: class I lanthipeptide [Polyangia bacterium]|nr:class I lanthipeptide [Polyangia bacterium]